MSRAIIQAGGKGMRLRPYTTVLPKPLMPVADNPILEIVIKQLAAHGLTDVTITIGHLGSLITAVVGDGSRWGSNVDYVWEEDPLGTIGPVTLVENLDQPFLVMNGDVLTDFDYRSFLESHIATGAEVSVGVVTKEIPVTLGVFDIDDDGLIVGFDEKPTLSFSCSAGIYALNPETLELMPRHEPFGFDDLMELCLAKGIDVRAHHHKGLWLDIGREEDYRYATEMFEQHAEKFLPDVPRT